MVASLAVVGIRAGAGAVERLPYRADLWSTVSPLHFASLKAHRIARAFFDGVFLAGFLVAIRLVARQTLTATVLARTPTARPSTL